MTNTGPGSGSQTLIRSKNATTAVEMTPVVFFNYHKCLIWFTFQKIIVYLQTETLTHYGQKRNIW